MFSAEKSLTFFCRFHAPIIETIFTIHTHKNSIQVCIKVSSRTFKEWEEKNYKIYHHSSSKIVNQTAFIPLQRCPSSSSYLSYSWVPIELWMSSVSSLSFSRARCFSLHQLVWEDKFMILFSFLRRRRLLHVIEGDEDKNDEEGEEEASREMW